MAQSETEFRYAEYDGDIYRWPVEAGTGLLIGLKDMERWYGDAWGEVAYGTDTRTKVLFYGSKYTPEAVVKETGTKDSIAPDKRRATTKKSGTRKTTRAKKGTLERAMGIAYEVHATQVDKNGEPYFLHPLRVMLSDPAWGLEERIVAVLHDVVEDSPEWTCDRLRKEGFSEDVVEAIDSVTRRSEERSGADAGPQDEEEKYLEYVRRAARNPIGLSVKLADLRDNCDPRRMKPARISPPEFKLISWPVDPESEWNPGLVWHLSRKGPDGRYHSVPPRYDTEEEAEARMAELVAEAESLPRIAEQKAEAETKQRNLRKKYKRAIKILEEN